MMVVQVVEVWVTSMSSSRIMKGSKPNYSLPVHLRTQNGHHSFYAPDLRPMIPGGPVPQCDVAIGMIKVLLDDVLSNVLLSVLTSVQYV
jgi:hypothetical protein